MRNAMSAARRVGIPAPDTTSAACRQGWRGTVEGTEAAPADVRDGDHRAVSAARELGRGGADRDVSGRVRCVGSRNITEALWGTRVSPSTVSDLKQEDLRDDRGVAQSSDRGEHPYVYLDGIVLKRSWAGEVRNVSLLVAIGVNESG